MAPVAAKDVSVDVNQAGSALNDTAPARRGQKRSADTPNPVDDKLDAKRLKSGDNSIQKHEPNASNGEDVITVQEEELVSKRREVQDFVKLVTKAVTAAKDDA